MKKEFVNFFYKTQLKKSTSSVFEKFYSLGKEVDIEI